MISFVGVVAAAAAVALLAGCVVHKGRARAEARAEVAAILRQYMPLEGDADVNGGIPGSRGGGNSDSGNAHFLPFGRARGNTTSSSSSAFFGGFAEGAAGAHSSSSGGSGNFSGSASEVGLTPTASSAEAEAEREEKRKAEGGAAAAPPPANNNV